MRGFFPDHVRERVAAIRGLSRLLGVAALVLSGCGGRGGGYRTEQAHLFCSNPRCGHVWSTDWPAYESAVAEAYAAGDARGAVPCPACGERTAIAARRCVNPQCGRLHNPAQVVCPFCGNDPKAQAAEPESP